MARLRDLPRSPADLGNDGHAMARRLALRGERLLFHREECAWVCVSVSS